MNNVKLRQAGMDVEELLERLMSNERLVSMFVKKFVEDATYQKLLTAIEKGDMQEAEFACHSLKGMCGNMSLKGLFADFQTQLGLFRGGESEKAIAMMAELSPRYEQSIALLREWLEENG